ncbi:MAG: DUF4340 domain-containing protein [Phycisphaerales bacterium]
MVRKNPRTSDDQSRTQPTPAGIPLLTDNPLPSHVNQITLQLSRHAGCVIERQTADGKPGWEQTSPFPYEMTDWKIDELVNDALSLRYTSKIKSADLPRDMKPSDLILTLKLDKGEHTLVFGPVAPAGGAYLWLDGQPDVYVVNADLHEKLLNKTPADFRPTALPNIPFGQVQQVMLHRDDLNVTLDRSGADNTNWAFSQGTTGRADGAAVESLVNTINFGTVEKFIADQPTDLARYGLAHPQITLTITESQQNAKITHTLRIGSPTDLNNTDYHAMFDDRPVVFTLGKSSIDRLTKPLNALRDARLTPVKQTDVREIAVTLAGDAAAVVHLQKADGRWVFADPKPGYALEPASADQLFDAVFKTKATDYMDAQEAQALHELAKIAFTPVGSSQPEELTVFEKDAKQLIVRRGNESPGYVVDRPQLSVVMKPALFYRDRTALDVKPADIAAIHVEGTGLFAATYDMARDKAGDFDLKGLSKEAFDTFLKAVAPLRAAEWRANDDDFRNPDETIILTTADGRKHTIALVSDRLIGHTDAGTFTLNVPTIDALAAELRDRVVIHLDVDQIATVGYDKVTITRDSSSQITVEGAAFGGAEAGKLLDTLAGLKAERFISSARPLKMDAAHPTHRLTITPRQGKPITLSIWVDGNDYNLPVVGQVDGGPLFTLAADPTDAVKPPEKK